MPRASMTTGSSPPVRGTPRLLRRDGAQLRFIPACAGNTLYPLVYWTLEPVHPRLCGEHLKLPGQAGASYGSSPPVRGTRSSGFRRGELLRFIPACAGNTYVDMWCITRSAVHPRLCGEHSSHKILKNKDFRDQQMRTSFSSYVLHVGEGFQTCLSAG